MNTENKKVRRRKVISLRFKLRILDRINKGERPAHVARSLGLNESTVRSIYVNEKKIRSSVGLGCPALACHTGRCRPKIIQKMEIELNNWITSCLEKADPPNTASIKQKALYIYSSLKQQGETPTTPPFAASSGWFDGFRKRFLIKTTKIKEEILSDKESDGCLEEPLVNPATKQFITNKKKGTFKRKQNKVITSKEIPGTKYKKSHHWASAITTSNNNEDTKLNKISNLKDKYSDSHFLHMQQSPKEDILPEIQQVADCKLVMNKINVELAPFTLKELRTGLDLAKQLEVYFINKDYCIERRTKFRTELQNCIAPYTKIYGHLKQLKITDFFQKHTQQINMTNK